MEQREGVESIVREIKHKTRRRYNSEEKIRIVVAIQNPIREVDKQNYQLLSWLSK